MLEHLDQQKTLTVNQWKIFAAATISDMLNFFDFLLIAFVLAFMVKDWNLTYGQSGAIPLSSGISSDAGPTVPQATVDALIPAMNYVAALYVLALVAVLFIGLETCRRAIEEIDRRSSQNDVSRSPGV